MGPVAAVAIPAAIQAASSVGSAVMGGKGAKQAAKIQAESYDKGLAFEREKELARRREYEQAVAAWAAGRKLLAARYGLNPDEVMPPGSMGSPPWLPTDAGTPAEVPGEEYGGYRKSGVPAQGGDLASLVQGQPAEIGSWSDWSRYGLA